MKKLYVVISAGRSAEDARPIAASSNPAVARATLRAILDEMEFRDGSGSLDRERVLELVQEDEAESEPGAGGQGGGGR